MFKHQNYKKILISYLFFLLISTSILYFISPFPFIKFFKHFAQLSFSVFIFMNFCSFLANRAYRKLIIQEKRDFFAGCLDSSDSRINLASIKTEGMTCFVLGSFWSNFQTIFIGQKMIATLSSEDLEVVLAHEIGHIHHRHSHYRLFFVSTIPIIFYMQFFVMISMIFLLPEISSLAAMVVTFGAVFGSAYLCRNFLQFLLHGQEWEADNFALNYAQIQPQLMEEVLLRLDVPRNNKAFLQTHPEVSKRIEWLAA